MWPTSSAVARGPTHVALQVPMTVQSVNWTATLLAQCYNLPQASVLALAMGTSSMLGPRSVLRRLNRDVLGHLVAHANVCPKVELTMDTLAPKAAADVVRQALLHSQDLQQAILANDSESTKELFELQIGGDRLLVDKLTSQLLQTIVTLIQVPDGLLELKHELQELIIESTHLKSLPPWMNEMTRLETLSLGGVSCFPNQQLKELSLGRDLKILRLEFLVALESLPHSGLLQLETLVITDCPQLAKLSQHVARLAKLHHLELKGALQDVPELLSSLEGLALLQHLTLSFLKLEALSIGSSSSLKTVKIEECATLLDLKIGELPALERLEVTDGHYRIREMTMLLDLANLQHLALGGGCVKHSKWNFAMTALPEDIGRLVNLKEFELYSMFAIKKLPDAFSTLTRLEKIAIGGNDAMKHLPCVGKLKSLKELDISTCLLLQMPGEFEGLKALESLVWYPEADPCLCFKTLAQAVPSLWQLKVLHFGSVSSVASREDALHLGRSLKAWPPLLLRSVNGLGLNRCWQELGLPAEAAYWDDDQQVIEHFRVEQQKVAAFASGMHRRLGEASQVSALLHDSFMIRMIANEVLGGGSLLEEWNRQGS
jgi:Leucine-rich repeat (LRR) protein